MLQILYRINSLFSKNTILSLFILVRILFSWKLTAYFLTPPGDRKDFAKKWSELFFFGGCQKTLLKTFRKFISDQKEKWQYSVFMLQILYRINSLFQKTLYCHFHSGQKWISEMFWARFFWHFEKAPWKRGWMGQNESKSLICFAQNNSEIRFWPEKKSQYSNFALQILYQKKKLATKIAILAFFFWSEFLFREIWLRIFRHFLKSCLFPTKKRDKKGTLFSKCQKNLAQNISEIHFWPEWKWQYSVFMLQILYRINSFFSKNTILSFSFWSEMNFEMFWARFFWHLKKVEKGTFFFKLSKKPCSKQFGNSFLTRMKMTV